ncbi:MAG TPA: M50 family metallopeptidase [Bacteroidales bacterium]|nr:M50 family metallopeptidase [Bacteroidales bacterium]
MNKLSLTLPENRTLIFYLLLSAALLLSRLPLIGRYFRVVSTMIHEAAHVFATLLVSGQLISINLFSDTSGSTVTKSKGKFSQFIIAVAGYPLTALTGFLLMYLLVNQNAMYILFVLLSIVMILMVLSIRNSYGLFWAATFALINILLVYFDNHIAIWIAAAFFTLIIVTDSLVSTIVLLAISYKNQKKAGDATNLHKITGVPAIIWALIFVAFSGFMVYLSVVKYFPSVKGLFQNL